MASAQNKSSNELIFASSFFAMENRFGVVVVGAGHAGLEAALSSSRMGVKTALITQDASRMVSISCNPSIGGLGKSHMVMELDSLGGEMPKLADQSAIQYKVLNRSKGRAIWALRAQIDKFIYAVKAGESAYRQKNLTIISNTVEDLIVSEGRDRCVEGVVLEKNKKVFSDTVVLCTGTFLGGQLFIGKNVIDGGRIGEKAATGLASRMRGHGFDIYRLKTGTPARVDKKSIDFKKLQEDWGDLDDRLSFTGDLSICRQKKLPCFRGLTNEKTHEIIKKNEDQSPLYSGNINGVGPRYCLSIEDKVRRFPDRSSHHIFLEPEGLDTDLYYVNGLSSCMPLKVQQSFMRSIEGLEEVNILKPAYAVEYDYIDPLHLRHSLETKKIENLFFAGQINGTSGYEEAASQGFVAGVNAAKKHLGNKPLVLDRNESYIGVLVDDLVLKGTREPYRMFTSRAENRLHLRSDNAKIRLDRHARNLNLIGAGEKKKRDLLIKQVVFFEKALNRVKVGEIPIGFFLNMEGLIKPKRIDSYSKDGGLSGDLLDGDKESFKNTYEGLKGEKCAALTRRNDFSFEKTVEIFGKFFLSELKSLQVYKKYGIEKEAKQFFSDKQEKGLDDFSSLDISALFVLSLLIASTDQKYKGYVQRQASEIKRLQSKLHLKIDKDFDYAALENLKKEAREKLTKIKPQTLAEATRVSGVSPSDIEVLHHHLIKNLARFPKVPT